jgi:hypothetical protein
MSWWWNNWGHVWIRARFPCSYSLFIVMSVPSAGIGAVVGAFVALCLARGLHVSLEQGRSMPRGSGEAEIIPNRAQGSGALMTLWGLG